jgi:hypothetical protein
MKRQELCHSIKESSFTRGGSPPHPTKHPPLNLPRWKPNQGSSENGKKTTKFLFIVSLLLIKTVRGRLSFRVLSFSFPPPRKAHSHSRLSFCVLSFPLPSLCTLHCLSHSPLPAKSHSNGIRTYNLSSKCARSYH